MAGFGTQSSVEKIEKELEELREELMHTRARKPGVSKLVIESALLQKIGNLQTELDELKANPEPRKAFLEVTILCDKDDDDEYVIATPGRGSQEVFVEEQHLCIPPSGSLSYADGVQVGKFITALNDFFQGYKIHMKDSDPGLGKLFDAVEHAAKNLYFSEFKSLTTYIPEEVKELLNRPEETIKEVKAEIQEASREDSRRRVAATFKTVRELEQIADKLPMKQIAHHIRRIAKEIIPLPEPNKNNPIYSIYIERKNGNTAEVYVNSDARLAIIGIVADLLHDSSE